MGENRVEEITRRCCCMDSPQYNIYKHNSILWLTYTKCFIGYLAYTLGQQWIAIDNSSPSFFCCRCRVKLSGGARGAALLQLIGCSLVSLSCTTSGLVLIIFMGVCVCLCEGRGWCVLKLERELRKYFSNGCISMPCSICIYSACSCINYDNDIRPWKCRDRSYLYWMCHFSAKRPHKGKEREEEVKVCSCIHYCSKLWLFFHRNWSYSGILQLLLIIIITVIIKTYWNDCIVITCWCLILSALQSNI